MYKRQSLYFTKIGPDEDLIKANSTPKDLRPQDQEPERKLLGDKNHHVLGFAVSPDSTSIATIAAPGSDAEAKEDAKVYLFDMTASELKELPAVSYTHLDVYKRQSIYQSSQ